MTRGSGNSARSSPACSDSSRSGPTTTRIRRSRFAGALDVVSTDDLYDIIEKKPGNYVDSEQFLRARLLDVFLGDWDRHRDQWRWAKVKNGETRFLWVPIPRDRDQAFVLFDGLLPGFARQTFPAAAQVRPEDTVR